MTQTPTHFVTAEFQFSHGRAPRGFGCWAFSQTPTSEPAFFQGTFTEAKAQAVKHFGAPRQLFVCP